MKILLSFLNFNSYTGSELYFYELSREFSNLGHEVTIVSNIGGDITRRATENGVRCLNFSDMPKENFDVIHLSHIPVIESFLANGFLPNVPIVCTNHSEIIPIEFPVINDRIKKYVYIRESIGELLLAKGVKKEKSKFIYNPIDFDRFNHDNTNDNGNILFAGSIDHLRKNALLATIDLAKAYNTKVIVIGRNDYPVSAFGSYVQFISPLWDIEKYVKECSYTSGIITGRTTIEGWACNKKGFVFNVDYMGNILDFKIEEPIENIEDYNSKKVVQQMIGMYRNILDK